MIAQLVLETGIGPKALLEDAEVLEEIKDIVASRLQERRNAALLARLGG